MKGFKGFNKDLQCRGFQYEVGKEYEQKGKISCCENGFHFCENPMDVFNYYPPADSRYCEVEGDGEIDKDNNDSKVACSRLKIGAEIGLRGLIEAGVKFILEKVDWQNQKESQSEDYSAATNTGYQSAATNTGDYSAASVEGKESVACSLGIEGKAKGVLGCWIVCAEWHYDESTYEWHRVDVQCVKVDGETIKPDTWYRLSQGQFIEIEEEEE